MYRRRLLTIPIAFLSAISLIMLSPLLFLIAFAASIAPGLRALPQALAFMLGYLYFECVGLLRLFWVWVRWRNSSAYPKANREIQAWWISNLLAMGQNIFKLTISVSGTHAIQGPSALVIARHTSLADTALPMVFFALARRESLRYVLKQELTVVPCLDVCGHRLPNVFVDRSGQDTAGQKAALGALISTAGPDESVLIYPEGTRYSRERHQNLEQSSPALASQLQRWPDLLPPRLGGVLALLEMNPGKDVVCLCHTGLEGSATLRDLVDGSWQSRRVRIHFWRIPFAEIPADLNQFINSQWDLMQAHIRQLRQLDEIDY